MGIRLTAYLLGGLILCASTHARNYFTEQFDNDFDIEFTTFTFKPDRSSNGYAVCRSPATEFPTPPTNGTFLDGFNSVAFNPGVPFFGQYHRSVFLNENGTVTFGEAGLDFSATVTLSNHFRLPRVSAWLNPQGNGPFNQPVRYQSLPDRVVLTWDYLTGNGQSNAFQLELFFDGVIRLTYLNMTQTQGIVGLSPGGGVPAGFSEANLSALGCAGEALYELVWSTPPSTVGVGQPFAANLSGRDAFNLSFPVNGPARLGAGKPGTMIFQTDFESGTGGFTVTNIPPFESNAWHRSTFRGTQVGHSPTHSMYFGYADNPLANPPTAAGRLVSPLLDLREVYPPIVLSFSLWASGVSSDVEVREEGRDVISRFAVGSIHFPLDTTNQWLRPSIDLSFYAGRQVRVMFSGMFFQAGIQPENGLAIDDIVITGTTNNIPVSPTLATFTGNNWSGTVTVGAPGDDIVLIAAHSNGVYGLSAPLDVSAPDDLILTAQLKRTNVLVSATNSIDILVSNTGPAGASAVVVTNDLPAGFTFGNVAVSQGSFSIAGNRLLLNLGGVGGGGYALASFEFVANTSGQFSITSAVGRAGSETFLANNRVVNTVNVGQPTVNIGAATTNEGAENIIFPLTLDAPVAQPVSVRFIAASDTAVAGQDFVATNGLVIIPPFTTNAEIRVRLIDDALFETRPFDARIPHNDEPEQFFLRLTSSTNAAIGVSEGVGTILDNEPVPDIIVTAENPLEGNAGTNLLPVVIRITSPAAKPVDLIVETLTGISFHRERSGDWLFGTARASTSGDNPQDFVPISPASVFVLSPGQTQLVVNIPIIGDTRPEPNEFFTILTTSDYLRPIPLGSPKPFRIEFTEVTIVDDDPALFAVDDYRVVAENCGTNNAALDPGETVSVLFRVRNVGFNACTTTNLKAALLPGGGVVNPSGPQTVGSTCGGGPEVWVPFTFTVGAQCGQQVNALFSLTDGTTNYTAAIVLPVGRYTRMFSESFNTNAPPSLPPGWSVAAPGGIPVGVTNEPPGTNQFLRINFVGTSIGVVTVATPPFTVSSTNAWLRLRHRFELSDPVAEVRVFLLTNGASAGSGRGWLGSSRGWSVEDVPLPFSVGATQTLVFQLFRLSGGNITATWDIDNVEVFSGPPQCCEGPAPFITSIRRVGTNVVLQWTAISNTSYLVQFRDSLSATVNWANLGTKVLARGATAAHTNAMTTSNRFYRVCLVP